MVHELFFRDGNFRRFFGPEFFETGKKKPALCYDFGQNSKGLKKAAHFFPFPLTTSLAVAHPELNMKAFQNLLF